MGPKKLFEEMLAFLIILNRQMGCTDEEATELERAEKIFYFYPEGILGNIIYLFLFYVFSILCNRCFIIDKAC